MKMVTSTKTSYFKKIYSFFLKGKSKEQLTRYLITGFSSFFLEYLLFFSMFKLMNIYELISNTIAITIVFWFNFLVNRFWSFKSKSKFSKQLFLYGCLFVFNTGISNLFIYVSSNHLNISPLLSKVFIMGLIVIWNFILYKTVIYRSVEKRG